VSYLSLFYTRFEFGRRLSLFYGQAAVGGALGGIISYIVFSRFPEIQDDHGEAGDPNLERKWQSWQVLFLLEGGLTIIVAMVGYFWLPHNVETAWFLTPQERHYASTRIIQDRVAQSGDTVPPSGEMEEEREYDEESRGLLNPSRPTTSHAAKAITDDRGLTPHDIASAFLSPRIWHILACNILSAVPVYAFQVFLPLVLAPLTDAPNPALVNLMTAPPNLCGAFALYMFARYSDKHRIRLIPVLVGLAIMVLGLTLVVSTPTTKAWAIPRYLALNILLSGCFIASPLTVAWISGNTPSPGKRALQLGINGWGNLAGVLAAMLFKPNYAKSGYIVPFWWTLACVATAAMGYILLWRNVKATNERRRELIRKWDEDEVEREKTSGTGPVEQQHRLIRMVIGMLRKSGLLPWAVDWLEEATQGGREGEEKMTFIYGL
jgi:MFS family permease